MNVILLEVIFYASVSQYSYVNTQPPLNCKCPDRNKHIFWPSYCVMGVGGGGGGARLGVNN